MRLLMDEATCVGVFVCCELNLMGGMMLSQQGQGHSRRRFGGMTVCGFYQRMSERECVSVCV